MLLLRRCGAAASRVASSSSSTSNAQVGAATAYGARSMMAAAAAGAGGGRHRGRGGGRRGGARFVKEEEGDSDADKEAELERQLEAQAMRERDPFGFRAVKAQYGAGSSSSTRGARAGVDDDDEEDEESERGPEGLAEREEREALEAEMAKTGRVRLGRNAFGLSSVPRAMADAWEAGVLPPQIYPGGAETGQNRRMEFPSDLYWAGQTETALPEDDENVLFPSLGERVYDPIESKEIAEEAIGGVCEGKKQRRGNQPLLCRKVDLEEVEFSNVAVLARFLSPAGMIQPRRVSGLCAKCQRRVAKTIKQSRHLGVLPHDSGVDLYKRLAPKPGDDALGDGAALLSRRGGAAAAAPAAGASKTQLLKRVPSVTI